MVWFVQVYQLINIMLKVGSFRASPTDFLLAAGFLREYALNLSLPPGNPMAQAQAVITNLEHYGRLAEPPNKPALNLLLEYLLQQGLGYDDRKFLEKLLGKDYYSVEA